MWNYEIWSFGKSRIKSCSSWKRGDCPRGTRGGSGGGQRLPRNSQLRGPNDSFPSRQRSGILRRILHQWKGGPRSRGRRLLVGSARSLHDETLRTKRRLRLLDSHRLHWDRRRAGCFCRRWPAGLVFDSIRAGFEVLCSTGQCSDAGTKQPPRVSGIYQTGFWDQWGV